MNLERLKQKHTPPFQFVQLQLRKLPLKAGYTGHKSIKVILILRFLFFYLEYKFLVHLQYCLSWHF